MKAFIFYVDSQINQKGLSKGKWKIKLIQPSDAEQRPVDMVMGWISQTSASQGKLLFNSKEEAVKYAESQGFSFELLEQSETYHKPHPKAYDENFSNSRKISWTH